MLEIIQAETNVQIEEARTIFREYKASVGLDLCFEGFEAELNSLPGRYGPPEGRLYLAYLDGELAGCIALRKIGEGVCEMKRLFLRENARGRGLGNALIEKLVHDARAIGYERMRLDTYPAKMAKAVSLYESHGFYEIPPYYDNPDEDDLFMEKIL